MPEPGRRAAGLGRGHGMRAAGRRRGDTAGRRGGQDADPRFACLIQGLARILGLVERNDHAAVTTP